MSLPPFPLARLHATFVLPPKTACVAITTLLFSSLVGLLLMLLGRREESMAVAESVVEGVVPLPAITRVMPLSWTATIVTSVRLPSHTNLVSDTHIQELLFCHTYMYSHRA